MREKVLIVEDDSVFRHYLFQVLKYDFDITLAEGPKEALERLKQDRYELMITDLRMPAMDGRDLVEKVHHEIDPEIMVIVITAYEDDWPADDALTSHVFRYLRKGSFLPGELKQNVYKALEIKRTVLSLRDSRQRADDKEKVLRKIFENSEEPLFITDSTLKPVLVNKGLEMITGYTRDDLSSMRVEDLFCEPDRPKIAGFLGEVLRGLDVKPLVARIRRAIGADKEVELSASLVRLNNSTIFLKGTIRPIDSERPFRDNLERRLRELSLSLENKETRLKDLDRRLREVVDNTRDIVIFFDSDLRCELANTRFKEVLGYTLKDIKDKKLRWKDILHPEDVHVLDDISNAVKKRLRHASGDVRLKTSLGSTVFLRYRASMSYNSDKMLKSLCIVATDITKERLAEQELRKANTRIRELNTHLSTTFGDRMRELKDSEIRYKCMVEGSGDVIWSMDEDGIITYINIKGMELLDLTHDEICGRPYRELISDDSSIKNINDAIEKIKANMQPDTFNVSFDTFEGKRILRVSLGMVNMGSAREFIFVGRDITSEVDNYNKLQLLANIEYYSYDAIIGLDTKGRIISWNQGAYMMFGWKEEEVIGRPVSIIIPDDVAREANGILDEVKTKGFVRDRETKSVTKAGKILAVSLTVTALKDEAGDISGFSSIIKDITQQKEMESALLRSERLIAAGKLAASIAHEINNPLYGIRSCLSHILGVNDTGDVDVHFVKLALKETDRIAALIRNMKTFHSPSGGKPELTDINEALRDIFILNKKYLEENSIELDFRPGQLPRVMCVCDQIKQVFINLITNAVEAMPGGGTLTIETKPPLDDKNAIEVVVSDTGVGIAKEDLQHVFDMFFTKKSEVKGVGLGLSVSYGIIKRHGGWIEVDSQPGKGSTFRVFIPVDALKDRQLHLIEIT